MKTKNRNLLLTCASAAALLTVFSASASAAGVAPPPLPPGSPMVKVEAGAPPAGAPRTERAPQHRKPRHKDHASARQRHHQQPGHAAQFAVTLKAPCAFTNLLEE